LTFKAQANTYLEIFAQVPIQNFAVVQLQNSCEATYSVSVNLYDEEKILVASESYSETANVENLALMLKVQPHELRCLFEVSPGRYRAVILVTDLENNDSFQFTKRINVPDYSLSNLSLSDLQLASSIKRSEENPSLVKSGWQIEPNVRHEFDRFLEPLYVYAELYNTEFRELDSSLRSRLIVRNMGGEDVKNLKMRNLKFGKNTTFAWKVPIHDLSAGRYELTLFVTDLINGQSVEKSTYFSIIEPQLLARQR
ncbi:MAG: hypothetical protein ACE5I1_32125, partial [bacterium]